MTDAISSLWHRLRCTRFRDVVRGRLNASLDWENVVALAGLPPELSAAVCQVVKRSRLWRSEKVDIATELTAHFLDGLEAGRTPAELLSSFGDPQASAQLIRRAKRRGRPGVWHMWRYCWIGLGAMLLLYLAAGLLMVIRHPSVKVDYLADFNKSAIAIPDDQRAWPVYRDALLAMGIGRAKDSPNFSLLEIIDAKPGDENWTKLEAFLKGHGDSLVKLRKAAARLSLGFAASTSQADFSPKDRELFGTSLSKEEVELSKLRTLEDRWLIATLLPHMIHLRDSGMLLAADARRAMAAGDGNTAFADVRAMFGVSHHCEELPFLICILVGDAIQTKARETIQGTLAANPKLWTSDQLRDLAHQIVASQIDWHSGFQGERTCFYDSMQRVYTDNGHGDGSLALQVSKDQNLFQLIESVTNGGPARTSMFANSGVAFLTLPAANLAVAGRKEMTKEYDRITDRALARLGEPYWTWKDQPSLDREVRAITDGPIARFRYFFVMLLTPSYDTFLNRVVASDGSRDGVLIGLALELYHRDHGKWPESLSELSPKYLPKMPADPVTGKPLHYKVVSDRPVVYSVGLDGDDDGGRPAKDKDGKSLTNSADFRTFHQGQAGTDQPAADGDWLLWSTAGKN